ncbi:MAG: Smr/MutS family protein, partial [Nitrospirota bacterium]
RVKVHDSEIKVNPALIQGIEQPGGQRIRAESLVRERRPPVPAEASALDLRGKRGEEAVVEIDRFLDKAILIGTKEVSLIHGHGTGKLRKMIREHLKESPYVLNYRPGEINEGGDGVTVVELQ